MLVIGKNPVLETLRTNASEINKIVLMKKLKPEPKLKEIAKLAESKKIRTMYLSYNEFKKFFDSKNKEEGISQGVIAFVRDYEYKALKEILDEIKAVKNPMILLLDNITDPHNLGAIARSAVCLGAEAIVIPRHNSAEVNHTVMKTSSGAVNYISIARETNLSNSIELLKKRGFMIFGTEANSGKTIFETDFLVPAAIIIGSEGTGVRKILLDKCDDLVRIPMAGKVSSLNASVSAAVFLYEAYRQKNT